MLNTNRNSHNNLSYFPYLSLYISKKETTALKFLLIFLVKMQSHISIDPKQNSS